MQSRYEYEKMAARRAEAFIFFIKTVFLLMMAFFLYKVIQRIINKLFIKEENQKPQKTVMHSIRFKKKYAADAKKRLTNRPNNQLKISSENSIESSESEEFIDQGVKIKAVKERKPKKHWKVESANYNELPSSILHESSKTTINAVIQKNANEINKHGKKIGTISIHPELLNLLDKDQTRILQNLCSSGHVIDGNTKGKCGLIFLDDEKSKKIGYKIKLKNCTKNVRFFAAQKSGGEPRDFEVTGYRPTHKNKQIINCV